MSIQALKFCKLILLSLALILAVSTAALAQSGGPNGKIVYVVNMGFPDYTTDIWVMDADGSNQVDLTNTPTISEYSPVWSPDGTKIAYVSGDAIFSGVWTMNADGTLQTKLSTFSGQEFGPSWSADSSKIALVRYVPGIVISTQFDIFVVALDGSSDVNLTNSDYDELEPAWSPDGKKIAFAGVRDGGAFTTLQIVTVSPDGTGEAVLVVMDEENRSPSWSPDSSMITFMSQFNNPCCGNWQVWAINSDGSGATNLSNDPTIYDMWPSWSPDGTLIIFSSTRNGGCCGETNIFTMPAPTKLPPAFAGKFSGTPGAVTQLTTNGASSDPDWASATACDTNCLRSNGILLNVRSDGALQAKIAVRNELRVPVANASVTVRWTQYGGRSKTVLALTDAQGFARFLQKVPPGTYTLTVVNITKQGSTFDPANSVLSKTITR